MTQNARGLLGAALSSLDAALKEYPMNLGARVEKADLLCKMSRTEEAIAVLEEVKELAPREGPIYQRLGRTYEAAGKPKKALEAYMAARDLADSKDVKELNRAIDRLQQQP